MAKQRQTTVNIIYKVNDSQLAKGNALLKKSSKATDDFRKSIDNSRKSSESAGRAFKNAGEDGSKSFGALNNVLKTVSFAIIANQVLSFTKQVIAVRGEFQKFEAVLTNTLGSKSAALIALGRINEFAKSTPFGVSELTNSFIKLANRGVEPTVKELRAIADLSATLGKDFDQVVEAILDINNPERWKEIGVKAETAGDKVKLSFRDAKIEVDRTVSGVTDAVVALGQLNGVAGSTEAISRTLAGQTSNLSDAWEQLLNTIGKGNEGVLFNAVSLLSQAIERANELLKNNEQKFEELTSQTLAAEVDSFTNWVNVLGDVEKAELIFSKKREGRLASIAKRQRELLDQKDTDKGVNIEREKELAQLRSLYEIYDTELPKAIAETAKALRDVGGGNEETIGLVAALENKIQDITKAIKETTQTGDLGKNGKLVKQLKETQEELNRLLGKDTDEDKDKKKAFDEYMKQLDEEMKAEFDLADRTRKENEERTRDSAKNSYEHWKYYQDLKVKKNKEAEDDIIAQMEDAAAQRRRIQEAFFAGVEDLIRGAADLVINTRNDDLDNLHDNYDKQVKLAGDNQRAKQELEIKFERDKERLQKEAGRRQKQKALLSIAIDTAINAVKLFGQTVPPGILSAIAIAFGAAQAGIVGAQKFKEGGWIKGPGSGTSDSVPILASNGEFMVRQSSASKSPKLLEQVNSGKLNDKVLKEIASGRSGGSTSQVFDDSNIVKELKNLKNSQPDVKRVGNIMYETKVKTDTYKLWIRSKSINS